MKVLVADGRSLVHTTCELLSKELSGALSAAEGALVGLSGGPSLGLLLRALPSVELPWQRVSIFALDDYGDAELSQSAFDSAFSERPPPVVEPMPASHPEDNRETPWARADSYTRRLGEKGRAHGAFDVAIVAVGERGDIGSIVPERPLNLESEPGYVIACGADGTSRPRIAANASLLTSSSCLIGLFVGAATGDAFRRFVDGESAATLPASLLRHAARGYAVADHDAASAVPGPWKNP